MMMVFLMTEVLECLQVTEDMDIDIKITAALPLSIVEFIVMIIKLVAMEAVDIGLKRPDTIPLAIV